MRVVKIDTNFRCFITRIIFRLYKKKIDIMKIGCASFIFQIYSIVFLYTMKESTEIVF